MYIWLHCAGGEQKTKQSPWAPVNIQVGEHVKEAYNKNQYNI